MKTKGAVRDTAKPVNIKTGCVWCDRGEFGLHQHQDPQFTIDPLFDYFDFDIPPLEREA